jgi:ABC-type amino acid transport substrate-binding protein
VDILIASMAYTTERSKTVEYVPQQYYTYYVEFMAKDNGPADFKALSGQTVSTVIGGVYEPWFKKCMPDVKVLGYSTIDQAFEAFAQGRSVAIAHDNTVLPGILARTKGNKISRDHIIPGYIGMAVRPGSGDLTVWLNEAVTALNNSDFYLKSLARNEAKPEAQAAFKSALPYTGHSMPVASPEISPGNSCDLIPSK